MDTNRYLSRCYDQRSYTCFDFVREIWRELTGVDLGNQTGDHETDIKELHVRALGVAAKLTRIEAATDPCLILFQRPRLAPHIGVFYQSRVLHLRERGPMYQAISQILPLYPEVSFYVNA